MRISEQGKQSRDDDTNNKEERDHKTNKLSCGSIHSVHESLDVLLSFFMLQFIAHVVVLVALYFMSPTQLLSMHQFYSLSDLFFNFLAEIHTAKMVL